jgi:hypothetical protein
MHSAQAPDLYDQTHFAQHHLRLDLRDMQQTQQTQQPQQPTRADQWPASAARQYAQAAQAAQLQQRHQQQQHPQQQRFSPYQYFQSAFAPVLVSQYHDHQLAPDMSTQSFGSFLIDERNMRPASPLMRDLMPTPTADMPLHLCLPRNQEATNPLDSVMLDFMAERRKASVKGTPSCSLVGLAYPSISSLLNPTRTPKTNPLGKVFVDVLANLPGIDQIPEQVACLYIMFLVMR